MLSLQTDKSDGSAKNKLDSSEPIIRWDESLKLGHESVKNVHQFGWLSKPGRYDSFSPHNSKSLTKLRLSYEYAPKVGLGGNISQKLMTNIAQITVCRLVPNQYQ